MSTKSRRSKNKKSDIKKRAINSKKSPRKRKNDNVCTLFLDCCNRKQSEMIKLLNKSSDENDKLISPEFSLSSAEKENGTINMEGYVTNEEGVTNENEIMNSEKNIDMEKDQENTDIQEDQESIEKQKKIREEQEVIEKDRNIHRQKPSEFLHQIRS